MRKSTELKEEKFNITYFLFSMHESVTSTDNTGDNTKHVYTPTCTCTCTYYLIDVST